MDYHSIHGRDISSFDLPSTHRLPTVSAADALQELHDNPDRFISTGLELLDAVLSNEPETDSPNAASYGGVQRGQITEIWGPPGAGKTTFGIELASNALASGKGVVWIDTWHPVSQTRLAAVCDAKATGSPLGWTQRLRHFMLWSLPHFIALLCRPTADAVPDDTILIVIDSLSSLINHACPRVLDSRFRSRANQEAAARRVQIVQYILGSLQKLAATREVAIVLLTPCATKMQAERGATLVPAISASSWDQGVMTRITLFRDWIWHEGKASSGNFAGLQKLNGKDYPGAIDSVVAFAIEERGIVPTSHNESQISVTISTAATQKQKSTTVPGDEIPDSEDEEYGWDEDDEDALLRMPTQWQGSEDILLGQDGGEEEDGPQNTTGEEEDQDDERGDKHEEKEDKEEE